MSHGRTHILAVDDDPGILTAIKQALVDMAKKPRGIEALQSFGAREFIETDDADFSYLYKLSSEIGIDLKVYHYQNR